MAVVMVRGEGGRGERGGGGGRREDRLVVGGVGRGGATNALITSTFVIV